MVKKLITFNLKLVDGETKANTHPLGPLMKYLHGG